MIEQLKKHSIFYVFVFLLLTLFSVFNFTNLSNDFFSKYQNESDGIIKQTIICQKNIGSDYLGGSLVLSKNTISSEDAINTTTCDPKIMAPYVSQYGAQAKIFGVLFKVSDLGIDKFIDFAKLISAIFFAITITLLIGFIRHEFGKIVAITSLVLILFSQWMILLAKSIYWQEFLLFLPFVFTLWLYPILINHSVKRALLFYAGLFIMISGKSLIGYEHLSTVVLSIILAILYHEIKQSGAIDIGLVKKMGKQSLLVFSVSILGFIFALSMHYIQLNSYYNNSDKTRAAIAERIKERTSPDKSKFYYDALFNFKVSSPVAYEALNNYIDIDGLRLAAQDNPRLVSKKVEILSFINYAFLPVLQIPFIASPLLGVLLGSFLFLAILSVLCALQFIKRYRKSTKNSRERSIYSLSVCLIVSFVAPLSWLILAKGHAIVHPHINGIVYYVPTLIFAYILFGIKTKEYVNLFLRK